MRYSLPILLSLIAVSAWAGTWRDDFNDGNLDGWKMTKGIWQGALMPGEGNWRVENGVAIGGPPQSPPLPKRKRKIRQ